MNRFIANLHPAFFRGGPETYGERLEKPEAPKARIITLRPDVINKLSDEKKAEYYDRVEQRFEAFQQNFQYLDSKDSSVHEAAKKSIQALFYRGS
jgi:hypothetical protein